METGIPYAPWGSTCACISCSQIFVDRLESELEKLLFPMKESITQELARLTECLTSHDLVREEKDERVEHFLASSQIKASQIRNNHTMTLIDRMDAFKELINSMDDELCKLNVEKQKIWASIEQVRTVLGIPHVLDETITFEQLEALSKSLQDELASRKASIQSSIFSIQKMWEIMAIPASEQIELTHELSSENFDRLEKEKRRLFDLQKERFREMLAAQENEIINLWAILEIPDEERTRQLEVFRSYSAAETLEKQSALIAELRPRAQAHSQIKPKIEKRQNLIQKMREFEVTASDPNRLFGSSFRLNQEERFRKAAYPTLVKIETELLDMLTAYKDSTYVVF